MRRMCVFLLLLPVAASFADERILSFHSDIRVLSDGWIDVTETIRVRSEGSRIQRGIYRDQFTRYEDSFGNDYVATLEVVSVRRDDRPENYHSVDIEDGVRTYFGSSHVFLAPGEYTYEYRYRASRMLGFFEQHDELYWTVTGFNWVFPIDEASARVSFEFAVDTADIRYEAYTGPYGARGTNYTAELVDGAVVFKANSPLSAVNGLTIVVGWPKGQVAEPTALQRFAWVVHDNRNVLIAGAGLLTLLAYFFPVWLKHGKDPEPGVIVTAYEPPHGYSPASLRYILQMAYDDKVMTAALVSLAAKGYLNIEYDDEEHIIRKNEPEAVPAALAPGEKELLDTLFGHGSRLTLDNSNFRRIDKAKSAHKASLKADYEHKYFSRNRSLGLPGFVIALGFSIAALMSGQQPTRLTFGIIVLMFLVLAVFVVIMKRPTLRGRELLDQIFGFRDYLEVAEKDELNLRNPPEKTPQLFERYLPYALALGVDQQWSEKFAQVLAGIRNPDGDGYRPGWYNGSFNPAALSTSTSSFTNDLHSAVRQSSQAPGSSSGFSSGGSSGGFSSGGGFSGGGGGGGGGGGW